MATGTNKPIGSTDPRDLLANAENLDQAANSQTKEAWLDRFGKQRKTWHGIEKQAQIDIYAAAAQATAQAEGYRDEARDARDDALAAAGAIGPLKFYDTHAQAMGDSANWPADGLVEVSRDETRDGARTRYRPNGAALDFVANLDQLRIDLAAAGGSAMVGHRGANVESALDDLKDAASDASTAIEDTQAELEAEKKSLSDTKRYLNELPFVRKSIENGGQLHKLSIALSDPFTQFLGVCIVGDSIAWGMSAEGINPIEPRSGSLGDTRNNGSSDSWTNLLHKHWGQSYFGMENAQEEAWPGSAGGIAQFTYTKSIRLFPGDKPFKSVGEFSSVVTESTVLGMSWFVNMSVSGGGPHSVSWKMTGTGFDLIFSATTVTAKYRLYVNDVLQGEYSTNSADLGIPESYRNVRTHEFQFVHDGTVRIEAVGGDVARSTLLIECIQIHRKLRVTNNGIIGASTREYKGLISQSLRSDDSFCIIQLGVNDRGYRDWTGAASQSAISNNLIEICKSVSAKGSNPILMSTNKAKTEPGVHYFSTTDVRSAVVLAAKSESVDVIDNFAATSGLSLDSYTADGLHPNNLGHKIIANNILNSIE